MHAMAIAIENHGIASICNDTMWILDQRTSMIFSRGWLYDGAAV
jgi:hypothetical protein